MEDIPVLADVDSIKTVVVRTFPVGPIRYIYILEDY